MSTNTPALIRNLVEELLAHKVEDYLGPEHTDYEEHKYSEARKDCCLHLLAVYSGKSLEKEFAVHAIEIAEHLKETMDDDQLVDAFLTYADEYPAELDQRVHELTRKIEA